MGLIDKEGRAEMFAIQGFISCSKDREVAEQFITPFEDKLPVLLKIKWSSRTGYWDCTNGPLPQEKEVLLYDGERFEVKEITTAQFEFPPNTGPLTLIELQHHNY